MREQLEKNLLQIYRRMKSKLKIDQHGNKYWKNSHNEYHREDGPAIELINGNKAWFINGQYHRANGPAIEWADGTKSWYLNGILYSEDKHNKLSFNILYGEQFVDEIEPVPPIMKTILEPITRKRLIELD